MGSVSETGSRTLPRSMRHKRILDAAAERPDATLEALAEEVPTATAELVERVLEKYGDPAAEDSEQNDTAADQTMAEQPQTNGSSREQHGQERTEPGDPPPGTGTGSEPATIPDVDDLTPAQRETLRAIADHPEATQRELADELDVADATVSNRVNAIDGFDWDERRAIVERLFAEADDTGSTADDAPAASANESDQLAALANRVDAVEEELAENSSSGSPDTPADRVEELETRIAALEDRTAELAPDSNAGFGSTGLTHKVVHACLESDRITEDEELEILQAILE